MATNTQVKSFIDTIYPLVQKEAVKRKKVGKPWVLPSVCIAQAALETGWGTSSMMTKANAYFGIKAGLSWKGKVYRSSTKECYDGVNLVTIKDSFRAYNSLQESIEDYYRLICDVPRYRKAVNCTSARKTITEIKKAGYATSPTYIESVMSVITCNNLTQYDEILKSYVLGNYRTKKKLRIRRGAGLTSKSIGAVPSGKKIKITQIQNKMWGYSSYYSGWICLKHCEKI